MTSARQNRNQTILSIENLYQQAQLETTQTIQTAPQHKPPLQRRQGFRLPLIGSKAVSFLIEKKQYEKISDAAEPFSEDVVLSGLKHPSSFSEKGHAPLLTHPSTGPQPASQAKAATSSAAQKNKSVKAPPSRRIDQEEDAADTHHLDPFNAIKQAVLSAQIAPPFAEQTALSPEPSYPAAQPQPEKHHDPLDDKQTAFVEKSTLENLVMQLSHLVEVEVEARLAETQHKLTKKTQKTAKNAAKKAAKKKILQNGKTRSKTSSPSKKSET